MLTAPIESGGAGVLLALMVSGAVHTWRREEPGTAHSVFVMVSAVTYPVFLLAVVLRARRWK